MHKSNTAKSLRAAFLIGKYLQRQLTEPEKVELEKWLAGSEQNRQLFRELCSPQAMETQLEQFGITDSEAGWQRLQHKINAGGSEQVKQVNRMGWWRSIAAIIVLSLVAWQVLHHVFNKPANKVTLASQYGEDVLPGTKRAQLTLSDGSTVALDNNADSAFTENGSFVQRNAGGSLVYTGGSRNKQTAWNTLYIPRGAEYMIVLDDGTKVWLNAATSLRYPVQFTGKERKVELLEGEAYFEVAKNKEKPFIVVANHMEVQAIGTAFDVNAYVTTDSSISTTLTEGRIKVKSKNSTNLLQPGEQVKAGAYTGEVLSADVEEITAWKNGLFVFKGTALPDVMEHIARWYDVKIEYDKTFKDRKFFTGEIKRNVPVSKLLQMMELTGIARFRIINNTIVILPYST